MSREPSHPSMITATMRPAAPSSAARRFAEFLTRLFGLGPDPSPGLESRPPSDRWARRRAKRRARAGRPDPLYTRSYPRSGRPVFVPGDVTAWRNARGD